MKNTKSITFKYTYIAEDHDVDITIKVHNPESETNTKIAVLNALQELISDMDDLPTEKDTSSPDASKELSEEKDDGIPKNEKVEIPPKEKLVETISVGSEDSINIAEEFLGS